MELTVLSFGGGQDSMAILCKLIYDSEFRKTYAPGSLVVVMADTGNEHPHTYKFLIVVEDLCKGNNIPFFLLKPNQENVSKAWMGGLSEHFKRYHVIISKAMRRKSCTDQLKIAPIYRFLDRYVNGVFLNNMFLSRGKLGLKVFADRYGRISVLLGISAEEAARRIDSSEPSRGWMRAINRVYPLVELGMNRADCQQYIRSVGQPVPYPSNCMKCPFLSQMEIVWLNRFFPAIFNEWVEDEKNKIEKFKAIQLERGKANHGVMGKILLPEILEKALLKYGHYSDDQLHEYKFSHGHCVKTSY